MTTVTTYNNNKATIKELKNNNEDMKQMVYANLCELLIELKLEGLSSKSAKVKAVATLKDKYPLCSYEISLIKLFLIDYDIKALKICDNYKELNKFRLSIKKDNLNKNQVIALFN